MERQVKKRLNEELDSEQKAEMKKMSFKQLMAVKSSAVVIYNECCHACKQFIIKNANKFKQTDLCLYCRGNKKILDALQKMHDINQDLKKK